MDTQMHRDAMPDADPSTLAQPDEVAERIADMLRDEERAGSGQRVIAPAWEVRS